MITPELRRFLEFAKSTGIDKTLEDACILFGTVKGSLEIVPEGLYDQIMFELRKVTMRYGHDATLEEVLMPKAKKAHFRVIGDVHGKFAQYAEVASEAEYSLQVGDMGFDYRYIAKIVDSDHHKAIGGNHDNYTQGPCCSQAVNCVAEDCPVCQGKGYIYPEQSKHFLGDYGTHEVPGFGSVFYVRGAWSIDYKYRTPGLSWWEDEEIPYKHMKKAIELYGKTKPDFMVTHTAPKMIIPDIPFERIFGPTIHGSRTEDMLQEMYDIHQPKMWLFGHWHVDWEKTLPHVKTRNETTFVCLDELSYKDFPKKEEA